MLDLKLLRGHQKEDKKITAVAAGSGVPVCRFVNVQLCGAADLKGTVLLENPHGTSVITLDQLKRQVRTPCSIHKFSSKTISSYLFVCAKNLRALSVPSIMKITNFLSALINNVGRHLFIKKN